MRYSGRYSVPPQSSSGGNAELNEALTRIEALELRMDRLVLVCMSMWQLLQARGMTEAELSKMFKALDLSDGVADGRLRRRRVGACSRCGRPTGQRQVKCMYCGAEKSLDAEQESVFDLVL